MANATTKSTTTADKPKTTKVFIPKDRRNKGEETDLVYINNTPYQVRKGEWVEVPVSVAEILRNREKALDKADRYAEEQLIGKN